MVDFNLYAAQRRINDQNHKIYYSLFTENPFLMGEESG